jgi:zinc protease
MEDLSAASLDDVKAFFRRYYVPNNASLAVAGDFDPKEARAWVEKYFGPIPKGEPVARPRAAQPGLGREVREQIDDRVQFPRLYMAWHSVPQYSSAAPRRRASTRTCARGRATPTAPARSSPSGAARGRSWPRRPSRGSRRGSRWRSS